MAAHEIDAAIRGGLAQALRADGFRADKRTFRRRVEHAVMVVNIQASQSNSGAFASFTMNLGVYYPWIDEIVGDSPNEAPKEYHCQLRCRIGKLLPSSPTGDHWWHLGPTTTGLDVAPSVERAYREHGRAWLEQQSEPLHAMESVLRWLTSTTSPHRVASITNATRRLRADRTEEILVTNDDSPGRRGLRRGVVRFARRGPGRIGFVTGRPPLGGGRLRHRGRRARIRACAPPRPASP